MRGLARIAAVWQKMDLLGFRRVLLALRRGLAMHFPLLSMGCMVVYYSLL